MTTLVTLIPLLADTGGWDHMDGWGGGWMWLWGSLMMLSWVAVVAGAIWLLTGGLRHDRSDRPTARDILDERYARGDIDTDEYRDRLQHLN